MKFHFILGASDPEMDQIEKILTNYGIEYQHAKKMVCELRQDKHISLKIVTYPPNVMSCLWNVRLLAMRQTVG